MGDESNKSGFSQDGRLKNIEYAINSLNKSSPSAAIKYDKGVILLSLKDQNNKLYCSYKGEKIFKLDNHIYTIVSGITSDANYLIEYARVQGQKYYYTFNNPMPIEQFVEKICDLKHSYTQKSGNRPFGASFIYAGYDRLNGFKIYFSDPSGLSTSWKAKAVGKNQPKMNEYLETHYTENMTYQEAKNLTMKVIMEGVDTKNPKADNFEILNLTKTDNNELRVTNLKLEEIKEIIENCNN